MTRTQCVSREAVVLAKGIKTKRGGDQLSAGHRLV